MQQILMIRAQQKIAIAINRLFIPLTAVETMHLQLKAPPQIILLLARTILEQEFRALQRSRAHCQSIRRFEVEQCASVLPGFSYFISTFLCYWRGDLSARRRLIVSWSKVQGIGFSIAPRHTERRRIISLEISLMNNSRQSCRYLRICPPRSVVAHVIRNDRLCKYRRRDEFPLSARSWHPLHFQTRSSSLRVHELPFLIFPSHTLGKRGRSTDNAGESWKNESPRLFPL